MKVYRNGLLYRQYDKNDIVINQNLFNIFENIITINASYYILADKGLFNSIFGETFEITDPQTWTINIQDGEYDSNDFSNEFLIN